MDGDAWVWGGGSGRVGVTFVFCVWELGLAVGGTAIFFGGPILIYAYLSNYFRCRRFVVCDYNCLFGSVVILGCVFRFLAYSVFLFHSCVSGVFGVCVCVSVLLLLLLSERVVCGDLVTKW